MSHLTSWELEALKNSTATLQATNTILKETLRLAIAHEKLAAAYSLLPITGLRNLFPELARRSPPIPDNSDPPSDQEYAVRRQWLQEHRGKPEAFT